MPAYLIGLFKTAAPEELLEYQARVPGIIAQYGGRYVVRGGDHEVLEGAPPGDRYVVVEFPDRAAVKRFYDSPEYREIVGLRTAASRGFLTAVDGA